MAKKKNTKKKGGGGGKKKSSGMKNFVNFQKLLGMGAGVFTNANLIKKIPGTGNLDPKLMAAAKIIGGEWLPNQDFAKKAIGDESLRNGFGDALIVKGVEELMSGFGIAGIRKVKPRGNQFLAVSVEGLKDPEEVSDDILAEDEYDVGDDLDTVNEDVLADDLDTVNDDMNDDDMNDDDMNDDEMNDDIDTVNEDVLAEDLL